MKKLIFILILFLNIGGLFGQIATYKIKYMCGKKYDKDLQAYGEWSPWTDEKVDSIKLFFSKYAVKITVGEDNKTLFTLTFREDVQGSKYTFDKKITVRAAGQEKEIPGEFYGNTNIEDLLSGKNIADLYLYVDKISYLGFRF
ncbi:hypothetical protein [Elizabethkingia meningoseptica]|uniref:hypothetical protein n=1 Tax=Elizabethkingia meningoseptica TaxID=238 RepID=UPI0038914891